MTVQVRTEISQGINAQVHFVAKSLGLKVSEVYSLIIQSYLNEMGLEEAVKHLGLYARMNDVTSEPLGSETGKARD